MELFEFVMVLVSIIVGLGITALLTGLADMLRARRTIRPYWVHSLVIVLVFLALAQVWWESWGLAAATEWSFVGLLMMLTSPICLFLISHLLFPETQAGTDYSEYYYSMGGAVWWIGAAAAISGTFFRPIVFGAPLAQAGNLATVPTVLVCVVLASTQDRRVHALGVPLIVLTILLDTLLVTGVQG